jgi:hypothetical protein
MIRRPLLPHYTTTVHVRPTRVAYFVEESDRIGFERAASIATTQWGGIHNLIVPVAIERDEQPVHWYFLDLLELFEPDVFVAYADQTRSESLRTSVLRMLAQRFPWRDVNLVDGNVFDRIDGSMHALAVLPDDERGRKSLVCRSVESWSSVVNLAVFGRIYEGQESLYSEHLSTTAETLDPVTTAFWDASADSAWNTSVLNLTSFRLHPRSVAGGSEHNAFDIVVGESVNSLCWYWSARALREATQFQDLGRRVLLCPYSVIETPAAFEAMLLMIRRKLPVMGLSSSIDLLFHTWTSEDYERVLPIVQQHRDLQKSADGRFTVNHQFGRDVVLQDTATRKLTFLFAAGDAPHSFRAGAGAGTPYPVQWTEDARNPIRHEPVAGIKPSWGSVFVDVECDVWKRLPRSKSLGSQVRADAWLSRWGLTHIAAAVGTAKYDEYFLPSEWAALAAWFQDKGFSIRLGQAGRYAEAMISLVGGLDRVELFATRQAYNLLYRLALKSSKKVAQRLSQLAGQEPDLLAALADLETGPELKGVPKTLNQLMSDPGLSPKDTVPQTVESLLGIGALRRGLYLECPRCGTSDWHAVAELQEQLTCPGCSERFALPLIDGKGRERVWQFRLNSLMNRAVDQDLVVNALTLFRETRKRAASCMTVGLEIVKGDVVETELDLCFVVDQSLIAAECKTGDRLETKDFDRARFAASLGFAEFIFVTTQSSWSKEVAEQLVTLADELKTAGVPMTIRTLSGDDLFHRT